MNRINSCLRAQVVLVDLGDLSRLLGLQQLQTLAVVAGVCTRRHIGFGELAEDHGRVLRPEWQRYHCRQHTIVFHLQRVLLLLVMPVAQLVVGDLM